MRKLQKDGRGGALASTLFIVLFLVVFGFTLANLAVFDLRTVSRNGQKQLAFGAAQAGLDAVISELCRNPQIGQSGEVFAETLADGSSYRVSFDSSSSNPWCHNNLGSLSGSTGYRGRSVPPLHASLFAEGTSPSGESSLVECLIRLEAIPYAVAGTGKVRLAGTRVFAVKQGATGGTEFEAHAYSGSPDSDSLRVEGLSRVSGDARSAGGIIVGLLADVAGETDPYRTPDTLPDLQIDTFRNDTVPGVTYIAGVLPVPVLTGQVYIDGDITFPALVTLVDATVFVDGDLTVVGALAGSGTLFVNGETNFLAGVNIAGNDRVTLFSQGDINIPLGGVLTGVLFTKGNFTSVAALTVFGAVYAVNELDSTQGNVNIGLLSTVIHRSDVTSFASYWLGIGGEADAIRVYWRKLR